MAYHLNQYSDADQLAHAAADMFTQIAAAAIRQTGRFTVALSGGSTPRALFELLRQSPYYERVDWANVHVFWGDERNVPPTHPDSNFAMANEALLAHVPIPAQQIHSIYGQPIAKEPDDLATLAEVRAAVYEANLWEFFGSAPRFDLILLGMGDDGHTASLFPHTHALHETTRWVVANYVEKLDTWRVTLTYPVLNSAAYVMFLVAGANKRQRLEQVLQGDYQPEVLPSQAVQPTDGELYWLVAVED